jgi:hypothetical protein
MAPCSQPLLYLNSPTPEKNAVLCTAAAGRHSSPPCWPLQTGYVHAQKSSNTTQHQKAQLIKRVHTRGRCCWPPLRPSPSLHPFSSQPLTPQASHHPSRCSWRSYIVTPKLATQHVSCGLPKLFPHDPTLAPVAPVLTAPSPTCKPAAACYPGSFQAPSKGQTPQVQGSSRWAAPYSSCMAQAPAACHDAPPAGTGCSAPLRTGSAKILCRSTTRNLAARSSLAVERAVPDPTAHT